MKKLVFLIGGILSSLAINAQVLNYNQAGILFTSDDNNGTARYNAMGGAFGALGGDISGVDINPAGLAVFKKTQFSGTLGVFNNDIISNFYGNSIETNDSKLDLTQFGGVLVLNGSRHAGARKVAVGFNYSRSKDFDSSWSSRGSSGFAPITDFYDPDLLYPNAEEQTFRNFTSGSNDKLVITFASQPNDKLYIGAAVTTHNLDFYQSTVAEEFNSDNDGNTFDVNAAEELAIVGNGVSFNVGLIAKPSQEVRLGVAYQSPTWYELSEESIVQEDQLFFNDQLDPSTGSASRSVFDYRLTTPSRLTGSFAYLFGKEGLISFDYTYKNFKNIELRPGNEFVNENQNFTNDLRATSQFKVGAEWRIDNVSLRGGYLFEESPYEDAIDTDHITGYSFGVGFKLNGGMKLDLAYQNRTNTDVYNFLNTDGADPVELDINNDKITATLVFTF